MRYELAGKRVRLSTTGDKYTKLKPGDCGVVDFTDDTGTVFITRGDGSGLGLNLKFGDTWEIIE